VADIDPINLLYQGQYDLFLALFNENELINQTYLIAKYYELNGHFQTALDLLNKSETSENSTFNFYMEKIFISYIYWRMRNYSLSIDLLDSIKEKIHKINNVDLLGEFFNTLGLVNWSLNDLNNALSNFNLAYEYRNTNTSQVILSNTLNNLGNTYLKLNNQKKALKYYNKSYTIRKQLNYSPLLALSYNSFGRLEELKKNHQKAEMYYKKSLVLWEQVNNTQFIGKSFRFLAINAKFQNQLSLEKKFWELSNQNFEKINNNFDLEYNKSFIANL